jgi:hypothetical protein
MIIVTSLALGAAGIAAAQPPDYANRPDQSDRDRDTSVNNPQGWFSLSARNHIESSREIVPVSGNMRWFRVEPRSGHPFIERLTVEFADGTQQDFQVGAPLRHAVTVDLHAERGVRQIIVQARPDPHASYSLFGQKG